MTFNWSKTAFILIDSLLAVYLFLAVTAFNRPDETSDVCKNVEIYIEESAVMGFLNKDEVKSLLLKTHLYPLGDPMNQVNVRKIEEALLQNPFIESAQCYKTQTGRVHINISQRFPIIRVKADNGDDYYVDNEGNIMPNTHFVSNLVVATGHIQRPYAQKVLTSIGRYLSQQPLWGNQIEQINVLSDGSIEMVPRVGDHVVYLGHPTNLEHKLARLEKFYKYGLSKAGWNKYSYINMEFDNQIICKKNKK
ncbi:MAG: cell division protein FtsQ/DivIB [Prevotella sp.]|nr:cell division protein FtsQ/DivIB [Prevotella sp.]